MYDCKASKAYVSSNPQQQFAAQAAQVSHHNRR